MKAFWLMVGLAVVAALVAIADDSEGQVAYQTITSSGPLDQIDLGVELSCQVRHILDPAQRQWYPPGTRPGDCGWLVEMGGALYAPNFASHGITATTVGLGAYTPFTPLGQSFVLGAGTWANPYRVFTNATMGATLVNLEAKDHYIVGREDYHSWINITNAGPTAQNIILYRAGDCYLGGSDQGYGAVGLSGPGAIACTKQPNNVPPDRLEELIPMTPGSRYYHAGYNAVWTWIGGGTVFPNTCACAALLDNGAGLSWQFTLAPNERRMFHSITRFAIDPNPTPSFNISSPPCGLTLTFTDTSTPGIGATLAQSRWTWGDATPPQTFNPWQAVVSHTYASPGTYLVTLNVTNSAGRAREMTQAVNAGACPIADFICQPSASVFRRVLFSDRSSSPSSPIATWQWNFGDGSPTDGTPSPVHDYPAMGYYNVTLTVTTAGGNSASVSKLCRALDNAPPIIQVPTPHRVYEGDTVRFTVTATDADGDPLTFSWIPGQVGSLGAVFDLGTQHFTWTTPPGSIGSYQGVEFSVTDGWVTSRGRADIFVEGLPTAPPPGNVDSDGDGVPDRHDPCPNRAGTNGGCVVASEDPDAPVPAPPGPDAVRPPGAPPTAADADRDGVPDAQDNCVFLVNPQQADIDRDGVGDVCDPDLDGDSVPQYDAAGRIWDNCPYHPNLDQADGVGDGIGDACRGDRDGDGVPDAEDNCAWTFNPQQADADGNGTGNGCENAPANPQAPIDPLSTPASRSTSKGNVGLWVGLGAGAAVAAGIAVVAALRRRRED